jgi:hypothetical protein
VNFQSVFDGFNHFDIIENLTVDPMHDILYGVGPLIMKLFIKV